MIWSMSPSYTGIRDTPADITPSYISDGSSSTLITTISALAVMTSCTVTSEKSIAALTSSEVSSSRTSSFSAVSMIVRSSSAARSDPSSFSSGNNRVIKFTNATVTYVTGLKITISTRTGLARTRENEVAFRSARIFGTVSPRIITRTVRIRVDTQV